jgi:hypothetical protein
VTATATPAPARSPIASRPVRGYATEALVVGALCLGHILLGFAGEVTSEIARWHALAVLAAALFVACTTHHAHRVAVAAAYVCGCEILWRMLDTNLFYEVVKYEVAAILAIGILRFAPHPRRWGLPVAYFLLLLPSALLTFRELGLLGARSDLSANLAGPLVLMVAVLMFSQFELPWSAARRILWALVIPCSGIVAVGVLNIERTRDIEFAPGSNVVAAGGFGPNQVSGILGLAAFCAVLIALWERRSLVLRVGAVVGALAFTAQALMTFSRGGLVNLVLALFVVLIHYVLTPRRLAALLVPMLALVLALAYVVIPRLDRFTDGQLVERVTDINPTNRAEIAEADIDAFKQEPVFGVGPGQAAERRISHLGRVAAHTEFTRMLGEHGMFGATALLLLLALVVRHYRHAVSLAGRAWAAGLSVWALTQMSHTAMRVTAASFIFGLAAARVRHRPVAVDAPQR